jgi:acetyl esterase/lipase
MQKHLLIVALIASLCTTVLGADDPRAVLRDAFDQSPVGWIKIHAADALIVAGEGQHVRDAMAPVAEKIPADAPLGYRIGVWRVLAGSAKDAAEHNGYVERIRTVALDAAAPDRLHAIESLAKLGWKATGDDRKTFTNLAKSAKPDEAPITWWLLAVAEPTAKAELVKLAAAKESVARLRASYALKRIGGLAVYEWGRIAENAIKPDEEELAKAYETSAAYVTALSSGSAERMKSRLVALLRDGTPKQQYECAFALGERGSAEDVSFLRSLLASDDADVRIAASSAILNIESRGGKAPPMPATRPTRPLPPAEGVTYEQDVPFLAPDRIEKLDLYLPTKREPGTRSPAVVMIHGGGWVGGDKAGGREHSVGVTLVQAGYVYASVNYQLDPTDRWPTNLLDCKNGVRFLRANADRYNIDPDRIGVIGSSAGGHLALMVAYTSGIAELEPTTPYPNVSSDVRAVVNLFGVTEIGTWSITDEKGNPLKPKPLPSLLFTATGGTTPEQLKQGSPVTYVSAKVPPTLTIHGAADTTVDRGQAMTLDARLKAAGAAHETILLDGVGHSFNLTHTWEKQPLDRDLRPVVVGFLDQHLKAAK